MEKPMENTLVTCRVSIVTMMNTHNYLHRKKVLTLRRCGVAGKLFLL